MIIKQLMMNEYEIVLFTLYLDEFGWENDTYELFEHLFYIGIFAKFLANKEMNFIIKHFHCAKSYFAWKAKMKVDRDFKIFDYKAMNERFKLLNKPYNCYCKKNYIDYNCVVDKIIYECQPYGEEFRNQICKNELNIFNRENKQPSKNHQNKQH